MTGIESGKPWTKAPDGSFLDGHGRVIYFSCERFIKSICEGGACFICGAIEAVDKPFNDEHVLPEWILRQFSLFDRKITLPNGVGYRYDRYKLRCCVGCNSALGAQIETKVRDVLSKGHSAVAEYFRAHRGLLFIVWMALIFVKTHLRDRSFNNTLDRHESQAPISCEYDWETLHHIHTLARSFATGAEIAREAVGTCFVLATKVTADSFDYGDLYEAQVAMLRCRDVALLVVFNDSGAAAPHLMRYMDGVSGPLSPIQVRELLAEAASCNLHLKHRPQYVSRVDLQQRTYRIQARLPGATPEFLTTDFELRGRLMERALHPLVSPTKAPPGHANVDDFWSAVRAGRLTFLYDEAGAFIR